MLYESFQIVWPRSASIVFQRWLRKFGFQHLIFLIFLRFGAEFCNFLDFSFRSFFELGIFKNWSQASQNDSQDAPGSILRPSEKHHFFYICLKKFSHYVGQWSYWTLSKINYLELSLCESKSKYPKLVTKNYPNSFECSKYHKLTKSDLQNLQKFNFYKN